MEKENTFIFQPTTYLVFLCLFYAVCLSILLISHNLSFDLLCIFPNTQFYPFCAQFARDFIYIFLLCFLKSFCKMNFLLLSFGELFFPPNRNKIFHLTFLLHFTGKTVIFNIGFRPPHRNIHKATIFNGRAAVRRSCYDSYVRRAVMSGTGNGCVSAAHDLFERFRGRTKRQIPCHPQSSGHPGNLTCVRRTGHAQHWRENLP